MSKSVILFGGTFDPPHVGHLTMAQLAWEQTRADEVWFMPSPCPPHKLEQAVFDFSLRVKMVEALIGLVDDKQIHLKVSSLESTLPYPSYTVDTVYHCKQQFPMVRFWFLIGSDSLAQIPSWGRAEELVRSVDFLVVPRSGYPFEDTLAKVKYQLPGLSATPISMPILDVSSSWIRQRILERKPTCGLVPDKVLSLFPNYPVE